MALPAGTQLGPYEILALLGGGGMGQVYRARDTKLDRLVAIKVLSGSIATDPHARSRFEQEAKAIAALAHPNILSIHDFACIGGVTFIVTELLDGENLRAALRVGPLPLRRVLDVATQIAEALAGAHVKGFVHRDLKPENVFLTRTGHAKLLDFGLAHRAPLQTRHEEGESPTLDKITTGGALVGTLAYMSPEQAKGQAVDYRSDQFSLGVLLYEMLACRRPFKGSSPAETLASIIRDSPEPLAAAAPATPEPLVWIVERCLAKDPRDRYESTEDLAKQLLDCRGHLSPADGARKTTSGREHPAFAPPAEDRAAPVRTRSSETPRSRLMATLAVAGLAVAGTALVWTAARQERVQPPATGGGRLREVLSTSSHIHSMALSGDGKMLAYVLEQDGRSDLYVSRSSRPTASASCSRGSPRTARRPRSASCPCSGGT